MAIPDDLDLLRIYSRLMHHFGDPEWWPGDTPFEIAVGAILTQNTAWSNVTLAINEMKERGFLSPEVIAGIDISELADAIKPAGYYNQKARYLKNLSVFLLEEVSGNPEGLHDMKLQEAREKLLNIKGIGKETADSILCYCAGFPIMVVDAYTWRMVRRLLGPGTDGYFPGRKYDDLASWITASLQGDHLFYNRFHALIVLTGKEYCRKRPLCGKCPLRDLCEYGRSDESMNTY